jgi:hypothetical protein
MPYIELWVYERMLEREIMILRALKCMAAPPICATRRSRSGTDGWNEESLAALVLRDAMIGVALLAIR